MRAVLLGVIFFLAASGARGGDIDRKSEDARAVGLGATARPVLSGIALDDEVRALIGVEYGAGFPGAPIAVHLSCTDEGGGGVWLEGVSDRRWSWGRAECQGRSVITLERVIGQEHGRPVRRISDALLLPVVQLDFVDPEALSLTDNGQCELKGRTDSSFVALVRWHGREAIDWRTGVEQAWTFDLKAGRIVPLPTRNIACFRIEP